MKPPETHFWTPSRLGQLAMSFSGEYINSAGHPLVEPGLIFAERETYAPSPQEALENFEALDQRSPDPQLPRGVRLPLAVLSRGTLQRLPGILLPPLGLKIVSSEERITGIELRQDGRLILDNDSPGTTFPHSRWKGEVDGIAFLYYLPGPGYLTTLTLRVQFEGKPWKDYSFTFGI